MRSNRPNEDYSSVSENGVSRSRRAPRCPLRPGTRRRVLRTPGGRRCRRACPYRGSVQILVNELMAGLKSSMSYSDSATLQEFRDKAQMVRVTGAGLSENHRTRRPSDYSWYSATYGQVATVLARVEAITDNECRRKLEAHVLDVATVVLATFAHQSAHTSTLLAPAVARCSSR